MMLRPLGAALRSLGKAFDGAGAAMQGGDAFVEKREPWDSQPGPHPLLRSRFSGSQSLRK
jgi:hypothetical protein